MKQNKISQKTLKLMGAAMALLVVGCESSDKSSVADFFPAEDTQRIRSFMTVQAACGARADATLQPMHFDGARLNSLGEAKLDLMIQDDDSLNPIVVYMNLQDKDEALRARRDAVVSYFEDHGLSQDEIKFESGSNPHATSLSAEHLSKFSKTDTGIEAAPASDAGSSSGTSAGSSSGGGTK